ASGLYCLLDHFPDASFDPVNIEHYNTQIIEDFERVRDFIVLHYWATERTDTPLWRYCRTMPVPDTLAARVELYRRTGRVFQQRYELFSDLSWFFVLDGLGVRPRDYNPLVDRASFEQVKAFMNEIRAGIGREVAAAPSHDSFFHSPAQPDLASSPRRVAR
ncbi:MAG TPA: tryptophan 7-halogenase, partial [Steroidobacteraceae bacterium]|nr:tryptophan 7-halogenase [Steroidobacteraceae bacterium]